MMGEGLIGVPGGGGAGPEAAEDVSNSWIAIGSRVQYDDSAVDEWGGGVVAGVVTLLLPQSSKSFRTDFCRTL